MNNQRQAIKYFQANTFKDWIPRLSRTKYIDFGSFPFDPDLLSNTSLLNALHTLLSRNSKHNVGIKALHFDAFYSTQVKDWFFNWLLPYIQPSIKHFSLKWDDWSFIPFKDINVIQQLFNRLWVNKKIKSILFFKFEKKKGKTKKNNIFYF